MVISIFGLGYVGAVSAGCLSNDGHTVIGVDPNQTKVKMVNNGQTPIIEKDIGELIANNVKLNRLWATTSPAEAVMDSELSIVCVGTPSHENGSLDFKYVLRVCEQIGSTIKRKESFHVVVIRSTILPGSIRNLVIPTLETASGKIAGKDFGVCNNPEFLREGSAVYDFYNPPKIVIGESDPQSGDKLFSLYHKIDAPLVRTTLEISEMVKYTDNTWHALKVAFANEIGSICKALHIDSHEVMNIFVKDNKLNISPYYMKPGFAFGGSCLPKDVRALTYRAKGLDLELPVLFNILLSNQKHIERGLQRIISKKKRKIGFLGFSFKAETDDLRESPVVEVIERLIGKGYDIRLYDRNVNLASLMGANRDYILNRIPHISKLMMSTIEGVLDHAETIVIGTGSPEFSNIHEKLKPGQEIVDFVRACNFSSKKGIYDGICW
jgi:GDP-mannose 6-dehydrogenase